MKALITGASSGIGRDMAKVLSDKGFDLILAARRINRLEELQKDLKTNVKIMGCDLSQEKACYDLYESCKTESIELVINNAGFGHFGAFDKTDLDKEMELIDVNIRAVHILTKLFLRDFKERDSGTILNVASSAAFLPGPLLSSYYASKAYVLRLTEAIHEELRQANSHVRVCALCPGPVRTEFNEVANVKFNIGSLSSEYVAKYAIEKALRGKLVIVPGVQMKIIRVLDKITPNCLLLPISYHIQRRRK